MKISQFLVCILQALSFVTAKRISEMKCDETASLHTDPRSKQPYLLEIINEYNSSCLVTLISENFVLTTSYCLNSIFMQSPRAGRVQKFKFSEDRYSSDDQTFYVKKIYYQKISQYVDLEDVEFDYALIELNISVPYRNAISIFRPVCLWTDIDYPSDELLLLTKARQNGQFSYSLGSFPVITNDECISMVDERLNYMRDNKILDKLMCLNTTTYRAEGTSPIVAKIRNQYHMFGIVCKEERRKFTFGLKINQVLSWIESIVWPNLDHPECGKRNVNTTISSRMTYAQDTYHGEYPWHVALFLNNRRYICGGTILNRHIILTAAHCVYNTTGTIAANRITIVAGTHDLNEFSSEAQNYIVASIMTHPNYHPTYKENDIAILKMKYPIEFSDFILPICISNTIDYRNITTGLVAGWGRKENNELSDLLLQATFPIRNSFDCRDSNRIFFPIYLNDHNYCAGYQNGTNACLGDSGGSMVFEHDSRFYIRGIVSLGVSMPGIDQCDITQLVLFTDVPKLYDWIEESSKITNSIKIESLQVPEVYILKNQHNPDPLILDCIYDIGVNETGLVLKWSHDNVVIYQWIPGGKPHALAHFKNRINLNHLASNEEQKKHRALYITKPTISMSGLYTCHAATYEGGSSRKNASLLVVEPESDFQLNHNLDDQGYLNIKCTVLGIAPKPKLQITLSEDHLLEVSDNDVTENENGLFDIVVKAKVLKDELTLPTSISCVIDIPKTGYSNKKTALYEIWPTTTTGIPNVIVGANTSEWSRLEATRSPNSDNSSSQSKTASIVLSTLLMVLSCWFKTVSV